MKKFFSLVLALVMALSLTTVAWGATFADDVAAAAAGTTVTLAGDANGDGIVIDKNLTIDLGGHTYTIDGALVGSSGTQTNGIQILAGNTVIIKNGTIKSTTAKILIQNYADLELINVNLEGGSVNALSMNCGEVSIEGTTSIKGDVDVSYWPSAYPAGTQVTIDTTGTIEGDIILGLYGDGTSLPASNATILEIENVNHEGSIEVVNGIPGYETGLTGTAADEFVEDNVEVSGGTFSEPVPDEYLADGVIQSAGGGIVAVPAGAAIPSGGPTLAPSIDDLAVPQYAAWKVKIVAEDVENAKKSTFATYTIEMLAKVDNAPIWWDNGVEEKGEDVDFEWYGFDEFVKVDAASAMFVVVDGKNITYFAPAEIFNDDAYEGGWDEKAAKVTLPYVVAAKRVCDIDYATDPTATTFYKYDGTLYVACALGNEDYIFNVNGIAVPAIAATNGTEYVNIGHDYQMDSKGNTYNEASLTKVYCDDCGKSFDFVVGGPAQAVAKFGVNGYDVAGTWGNATVYVATYGTVSGSSSSSSTSTDKVTSAETFDAGIAMYVGMSVMAAAGSAVVLKKRED